MQAVSPDSREVTEHKAKSNEEIFMKNLRRPRQENQMKSSWKRVSEVVLIAVIVFGMIAPGLQAGPVATGKFKLPFDVQLETQFGKMALPAGDYTFKVDNLVANGAITISGADWNVLMVHPQTFNNNQNQSQKPVLVCIRHDGNVTVRALRLPRVGTFYFSLSKELKVLVAQEPQLIQTVEVSGD
jgi:hypothetical protein